MANNLPISSGTVEPKRVLVGKVYAYKATLFFDQHASFLGFHINKAQVSSN